MTTMEEEEDVGRLINQFRWSDYLVFAGMLVVSAVIGVYYACIGGKQSTTNEFLMAGRNMGKWSYSKRDTMAC